MVVGGVYVINGYIDTTGKMILSGERGEYDKARSFSEGLAAVAFSSGIMQDKWGYIDKTGNMLIEPQFEYAEGFREGLAVVGMHDEWGQKKYGYIDKTGKIVIKPQFDDARDFVHGFARVKIGKKWGHIDKTGRIISKQLFLLVGPFSEEGLARVAISKEPYGDPEYIWGYIDTTGKIVIEPQFEYAGDFTNGLAEVHVRKPTEAFIMMGYINKKGKYVWKPQYIQ